MPEVSETVVAAARRGEAWAEAHLAELIRSFSGHVCRNLGQGLCDFDPEDVSQEAARRFFAAGIGQFRGAGSEKSYLYSVVRATFIDLRRRAGRRLLREDAYSRRTPETAMPQDHRLDVESILARLDPACRELLEEVFLDETAYEFLAGRLGITVSSVRSRVFRCLQKARETAVGR